MKTSINVKVALVVILLAFILGYAGGYLGRDATNELDNYNWCVRELEKTDPDNPFLYTNFTDFSP